MYQAFIIYGREESKKNEWYISEFIKEGKILGIHIQLLLAEELEFGVKENQYFICYEKKKMQMPDFCIVRTIYPMLNKQLESMGIRTFNNSFVSEICNDKAKTYQYVAKTGIQMIDTSFKRACEIDDVLSQIEESVVIKAVDGHGGNEVFLLTKENIEGLHEVVRTSITSDFVIQPLSGNKKQDLRIYILGNRILAAVLRTAKEGFKSNFSLGGDVRLYELSYKEIEIVEKITKLFSFGLVGVDFLIGEQGQLIFNEIEDVVGARMLYQCTNINLVKEYLMFILEEMNKSC